MLTSHADPTAAEFQANRAYQLGLIDRLDEQLRLAVAGGGERYVARHRARGRLTVRERIELLLDRDGPFLELSTLAAWGTEFTVGATVVTGIGVVSGVEAMVIGHDPTVRGIASTTITAFGILYGSRWPRSAASSLASSTVAPGLGTTTAVIASLHRSCGSPITTTSPTAGSAA